LRGKTHCNLSDSKERYSKSLASLLYRLMNGQLYMEIGPWTHERLWFSVTEAALERVLSSSVQYLPHFTQKGFRVEGFMNKDDTWVESAVTEDRLIRIA
jgi:hypothetical protein